MQTQITTDPEEAASFLRRGELVAFPTETVYGLGANALDAGAVSKIFEAKGRPPDNPLIVHLSGFGRIDEVVSAVSPHARALVDAFFPGPLTLVMPRHELIPPAVSAGLPTVGVRMPDHAVARSFLAHCGCPVAAPSANRSGRPSPTTWRAVRADLDGRIACILEAEPTRVGLESTVVDCTGPAPIVLRVGALSVEALQGCVPETRLADEADALARSPGTRHRHYAPRAAVHVTSRPSEVRPGPLVAFIGMEPPAHPERFGLCTTVPTVEHYARALFAFFRRADADGMQAIFCQEVPDSGLGRALNDRLRRAAHASD